MNKLMFTGPQLSSLKESLQIQNLIDRLTALEKELAKPKLEDLWVVEFIELEEGFAPRSNYSTDAGHDLKICPNQINIKAIDYLKQYLQASEETLYAMPKLYVDGKHQDWYHMFVEDRTVLLNNLFAKVNKEPVVCLGSKSSAENNELVSCGFKVALPDLSVIPGWTSVMIATPRSGLGINCKIQLCNTIGVIDQGYRGEVKLSLNNNSDAIHIFTKGARVAQALILPCINISEKNRSLVTNINKTEREEKGFGSSGVG